MTKAAKTPAKKPQANLKAEILIGIIGFILSISLHEGFHLLIHWDQIAGVRFFPNFYTVAELVVNIPASYDLASEEFIAYAISATVLLLTAATIAAVYDSSDSRSVRQILFPQKSKPATPTKKASAKKQ